MKMKMRMILMVLIAAIAVGCSQQGSTVGEKTRPRPVDETSTQPLQSQARIPAFQVARAAVNLPQTLQPEQFYGPTRDAYRVVKEIPETIAQLPCYCYCDSSIGHKSLHSCFVDTHASQCTVCVNEALIAYNMQKSGSTPAQIREYIIQQYSRQQ